MEHLDLEYYYGIESEEFAYIKFPRLLIKDKRYRALDSDARSFMALCWTGCRYHRRMTGTTTKDGHISTIRWMRHRRTWEEGERRR